MVHGGGIEVREEGREGGRERGKRKNEREKGGRFRVQLGLGGIHQFRGSPKAGFIHPWAWDHLCFGRHTTKATGLICLGHRQVCCGDLMYLWLAHILALFL